MHAVADSRLRDLRDERLRVSQQNALKGTTTRKLLLQSFSGYLKSVSADLHHGPMGDCATPEE
jgi:hypothetical protein